MRLLAEPASQKRFGERRRPSSRDLATKQRCAASRSSASSASVRRPRGSRVSSSPSRRGHPWPRRSRDSGPRASGSRRAGRPSDRSGCHEGEDRGGFPRSRQDTARRVDLGLVVEPQSGGTEKQRRDGELLRNDEAAGVVRNSSFRIGGGRGECVDAGDRGRARDPPSTRVSPAGSSPLVSDHVNVQFRPSQRGWRRRERSPRPSRVARS